MDGVKAIVQVLMADAGVTALVPSTRIMAGVLPQGTALPAISVSSVSAVTRGTLVKGGVTMRRQRVQVTVMAATYASQASIQKAVIKAAHAKFPTVTGLSNVTLHHDSSGPDFMNEEASVYLGTDDFQATYSEVI
jgi:hypothetical protein